jgi:2-keto-4-pentenoate hydratase
MAGPDPQTELALAGALEKARRDRTPIAPIAGAHPDLTVEAAYRIQQHGLDARRGAGAKDVGRKIGLTSEAMQRQLGVDQPDYGTLLDEMVLPSGSAVRANGLIAPRVEAEIAVRMGAAVGGPDVSADEVLAAVAAVVPALEIIDSRIVDWKISLVDTIADNASSALAIVGPDLPLSGVPDLADLSVAVYEDDAVVGQGTGAALLGHPAKSLCWLARALGRMGDALRPGDLVLLGAVHASVPLRAGHRYRAVYAPEGSVDCTAE